MSSRLTLPNDQWVDVKDTLKVVDKKHVHTYSVDGVSQAIDGQSHTYRFNIVKHQIATAAVRIVNWALMDDGSTHKDQKPQPIHWPMGKPFKEKVEAIENLDEEVFDAITQAIDQHVKAREVEADDAKKETLDGEIVSGPSLPAAS